MRPSPIILTCLLAAATYAAPTDILARRTTTSPGDTVEIALLRVAFAEEVKDNSLTTGTGRFDSDKDKVDKPYLLDPQGARKSRQYWEKQLQRATDYWSKVSRGTITIVPRIYPEGDSTAYILPKSMVDYKRTKRLDGEKMAQFDSAQTALYLSFVRDALRMADSTSPGLKLQGSSGRTHRVPLIVHAGASAMLDGGSLGTKGANTPADFGDFFADSTTFAYLRDIKGAQADTNGILLSNGRINGAAVLSETMSQDGVNWGTAGTLIHLIARSMGLPVSYDAVTGTSRLGGFDLMDYAGANAGNGFFPVLPMAWYRMMLGWDEATVVSPGPNGKAVWKIAPASSGLDSLPKILKIPLSSDEYLLVENRQRSPQFGEKVAIVTDSGSVQAPADSLFATLRDSLCEKSVCKPSPYRLKGIIASTSAGDYGLPASGVLVWRINERALRAYLSSGSVNARPDSLIADRFPGISLIEADGLQTMGKGFSGQGGQKSYDFGHAGKVFPHLVWKKGTKPDTIQSLKAPLLSANAAQTGLTLRFRLPEKTTLEKATHPFTGDSIASFQAPWIEVDVDWNTASYRPLASAKSLAPANPHAIFGDAQLWIANKDGIVQGWTQGGQGLAPQRPIGAQSTLNIAPMLRDTSLRDSTATSSPVLAHLHDTLLGATGPWLLGQKNLYRITAPKNNNDTATVDRFTLDKTPVLPPIGSGDGGVWIVSNEQLSWINASGQTDKHWPLTTSCTVQSTTLDPQGTLGLACAQGVILLAHKDSTALRSLNPWGTTPPSDLQQQFFRIASTDIDHDGITDYILAGSRGSITAMDALGKKKAGWPVRIARGQDANGRIGTALAPDSSAIALSDLDHDGSPEILLTGANRLWALSANGSPLPGFPWTPGRGLQLDQTNTYKAPGLFGNAPLIFDVDGDGQEDILLSTPNGNAYAINAKGQTLPGWPLLLGSSPNDSATAPFWHLSAQASDSGVVLFGIGANTWKSWLLPKATLASNSWTQNGATLARSNYFDNTATASTDRTAIDAFYLYPNPVKNGRPSLVVDLGRNAASAQLEVFNAVGHRVRALDLGALPKGRSQIQNMDLSGLGADVYAVRLEVDFGGSSLEQWFRIAILR